MGGYKMIRRNIYRINTISKTTIEERAIKLAEYIIKSKDTVRGAAKKFRSK